jgi:hypothetical protein
MKKLFLYFVVCFRSYTRSEIFGLVRFSIRALIFISADAV